MYVAGVNKSYNSGKMSKRTFFQNRLTFQMWNKQLCRATHIDTCF